MQWVRLGEGCWIGRDLPASPASVVSHLRSLELPYVSEIVPAFESVGVYTSSPSFDSTQLPTRLPSLEPIIGKAWEVPLCYELGEDFDRACTTLNVSPLEFVSVHSKEPYTCRAVGFSPGFPYLDGLPLTFHRLLRKETPRVSVPIGSVAIAAGQCGIYPQSTPGGWWLIGRTPCRLIDIEAGQFTIRAGDTVYFRPISLSEFHVLESEARFIQCQ